MNIYFLYLFPFKTIPLKQFRNKRFAYIRSILPGLMIAALLLNIFSYSVIDTRVKQKGFTVSNASQNPQVAENTPEGETSEETEIEMEDDDFDHLVAEGHNYFIILKIFSSFHYYQFYPGSTTEIPTPPPAHLA